MKNLNKNILLSVLSVTIFFGGLEFAQRVRYSFTQGNKMYLLYGIKKTMIEDKKDSSPIRWIDTYKEIPYKGLKGIPGDYSREYKGKRFLVHINKLGFRDEEIELEKKEEILRIVILGGSSVLGLETPDNETLTSILEDIINKDSDFLNNIGKTRAEVINAGIGGATSAVVSLMLKKEVLPLHPDIAIIYCAFNNIRKAGVIDEAGNYRTSFIIKLLGERAWEWLYSHSLLFASAYEKFYLFAKKKISLRYAEIIFNQYENDIREMTAVAERNGMRLILIKQPLLIKGVPAPLEDERTVADIERQIKDGNRVTYEEAYYWMQSRMLKILDDISAQRNIMLIDPISEMEKDKESLFFDIVHRTETGNRRLAEIIYSSLKKRLPSYSLSEARLPYTF